MLVIPAIDLREAKLSASGREAAAQTTYALDPIEVAADFKAKGRGSTWWFGRRFSGQQNHQEIIAEIAKLGLDVEVEGLRSLEALKELSSRGALGDFRDCCGKES